MEEPSMSELLRVALDATQRGWHVFPLRPDDKRPALHGVTRCPATGPCTAGHVGWEQRATVDPVRIRACWSAAPYNVGIACGPSGLVVLDLDTPKPVQPTPDSWAIEGVHDGADVLAALCEQAGQPWPDVTYTVATGRGGTHLYYRHPHGGTPLRNTTGGTAGSLGWLVDTRAGGGYVVAAGSTVAGNPYTVAFDTDPVPLPAWLAERLTPKPLPPQQPVTVTLGAGRRAAYLDAAISRSLAAITDAPAGTLNRTLYGASVALGQLVAGGALAANDAEALLLRAAVEAGHPIGSATRTIRSGFRAGTHRPRSVAA
jgi:hypothetical protein